MTGKPGNQRIPMVFKTVKTAQQKVQLRAMMKAIAQRSMEVRVIAMAL